jgi:alkylation response protein AidB-like acyl-CoA dehydrogenase
MLHQRPGGGCQRLLRDDINPGTVIAQRRKEAMTSHIMERSATLEAVRTLSPAIVARSEAIERGRRVPADLVEELTAAGCFRALVPRSHGGAELHLPDDLRVLEELARADGSVGWTVMIGSLAPVLLGKLPRATFDALYAEGPDVILAGTVKPSGVATPVDGGFRVTGRWSFASGCQHSDWFVAHCIVHDGRQPPIRMMVLPPADVEITDTWSVSGLCGTGSHDFVVNDAFVPDERSFVLWDEPCLDAPLLRIPELSLSSLRIGVVAVGIAHGALREVTDLAIGKVPLFSDGTLASNPLFQHQLADADARLRAARALLYADAETAWTTAVAGAPFTPEHRAQIRGTATWVAKTAASVVDMAYTAGGGSSIFATSPLQRRLRDIHALTQHFAVKLDTFTKAGAVLAGQDVDLTFL